MAGSDPRSLTPVQVDVVMLATDICSFTTLSEGSPLEGVWELCNSFIDTCTTARGWLLRETIGGVPCIGAGL